MKILTINLKASDSKATIKERVKPLISFVLQNNIDIVLVQEAPAGIISWLKGNSFNTVGYIANKLDYFWSQCRMTGWPFLYNIKLGIISKNEIKYESSGKIFNMPMIDFKDFKWDAAHLFPWTRKILAAYIDDTAFFCTHFGRENGNTQIVIETDNIMKFVHNRQREWAAMKSIVAGDLNYNYNPDKPDLFYNTITMDGFIDSQAESKDIITFGVNNNPYSDIKHKPPYRIDYVFAKNMKVEKVDTVLNTIDTFVSDHCGVYVELI